MVTTRQILLTFSLLLLLLSPAFAADIKVFVDQDQLRLDQSFRLYFEANGSVDDDPDFNPLKSDFEILSRNVSSSTSFVNGSFSSKKTWILTLIAKSSGTLTIPAVSFGSDQSPPLSLTIGTADTRTKTSQNKDLYLEVDAQPKSAYVQQQVIYSVRLYRRLEITNASLSDPEFSTGEAISEKIGEDHSYETIVDGRRYLVIERQYAVFPQQQGKLEIAPIRFSGQLLQNQRSFFGPLTQAGPIRRFSSDSVTIDIKPVPSSFTGKTWLPVKNLQISEDWSTDPSQLVVGEPATHTLKLTAHGALASLLPKLTADQLAQFKLYPDQPQLENQYQKQLAVGSREEKVAIIPTSSGKFTLPEQKISWWNTTTDQQETLVIKGRTLQVAPPFITHPPASTESPKQLPAAEPQQPAKVPITSKEDALIWKVLTFICAAGWFLTALVWFRSRKKWAKKAPHVSKVAPSLSQARKKLRQACNNNDVSAAAKVLLEWGKQNWSADPPCNLAEIGRRTNHDLQQQIEQLDKILYSQNATEWIGQELWRVFNQAKGNGLSKNSRKTDQLETLYLK
ncbi:BatD family protein [Malonomonas rubra]|uniref:BatD family protein n=1 Tax=Malonomonas rubra TaxID=57040 RepID=UPI0026E95A2D|nr:BatD family protein [Malonomonas rubra]